MKKLDIGDDHSKKTILVVDDEASVLKFLGDSLRLYGFRAILAQDGGEALSSMVEARPDLIILDINIPTVDGFEIIQWLREWSQIPIIMISGRSSEEDKVKCLNLGADDYLCKPFGLKELLARVKAVLRRTELSAVFTEATFCHQNLEINFVERRVTLSGREVKLTPIEYNLLREMALNANKVLTHNMLITKVWGTEYGGEKEYLRVFMNRLRKRLSDHGEKPKYIMTIPGVGYQLKTYS